MYCLIALGPYYCAQYDEITATTDCMDMYQNINTTALASYTAGFASSGLLDGTGNMTNDRVFILSGVNDTTVRQGASHTFITDCFSGRVMQSVDCVRVSLCIRTITL